MDTAFSVIDVVANGVKYVIAAKVPGGVEIVDDIGQYYGQWESIESFLGKQKAGRRPWLNRSPIGNAEIIVRQTGKR